MYKPHEYGEVILPLTVIRRFDCILSDTKDDAVRDMEYVPLTEDIQAYFEREVMPFASDAWIDEKKSRVGYEIPSPATSTNTKPPDRPLRSWQRFWI